MSVSFSTSRYSTPRKEAPHARVRHALRPARPRRSRGAASRRRAQHSTFKEAGMATTEPAYRVLSLPQEGREAEGDRFKIRLRPARDIAASGARASYQAKTGEDGAGEHDEL